METPKFDLKTKNGRKLFYSETKKQIQEIEKIQNLKEHDLTKLKIKIKLLSSDDEKVITNEDGFFKKIIFKIKKIIFTILNIYNERIK
jgi:hypothetical protein